jgi:hypothetical protein
MQTHIMGDNAFDGKKLFHIDRLAFHPPVLALFLQSLFSLLGNTPHLFDTGTIETMWPIAMDFISHHRHLPLNSLSP